MGLLFFCFRIYLCENIKKASFFIKLSGTYIGKPSKRKIKCLPGFPLLGVSLFRRMLLWKVCFVVVGAVSGK